MQIRGVLGVMAVSLVACGGDDTGPSAMESTSDPTSGSASGETTEAATTVAPTTSGADGSSDGSSGEAGGYLDVYDIDGDEVFPEGVAFDPVGEAFFVGSLGDGGVRRIAVDGTQTLHAPAPRGTWTSSGLKVDAAAGRIWVCANDQDAGTGSIWQLDLETGEEQDRVALDDIVAGGACNDVALDGSGRVYVSDPGLGIVHRIEAGVGGEAWAMHEDFAAQIPGLGLNGMAVTPDDAYLIVAFFKPEALFRVAIDDPTDIVTVELSGDAFVGGTALTGCDGIVFEEDALYVTFADLVKRVDFDAGWGTGTVSTFEVPGVGNGLSTATVAGGSVYVVKSEVTAWVLGSEPSLPFQIVRVPGT